MKRFWKEYGWLALSIAVAMVGYVLFTQHKKDIVSYSLDAIGSRLVAMVEAPEQKATIAAFFESYKQRVLSHEVAPDQVAGMAANVLNLSNSGARLSPAEAELVLTYPGSAPVLAEGPLAAGEPEQAAGASAPPASAPAVSPGVPVPPPSATPEALAALGERLAMMLAFNDQVQSAARLDSEVRTDLAAQIKYHADDGLRVLLDPRLQDRLSKQDFARLHSKLNALEKEKLVVWQVHLADSTRARQEHVRHALQTLRVLQRRGGASPPWDTLRLAPLEALMHMEANGFRPGPGRDSLSVLIQEAFAQAAARGLESQAAALEAAARDLEAASSAKGHATPPPP